MFSISYPGTKLLLHTLLLYAAISTAGYAGAPDLFASFLVGSLISWFDEKPIEKIQMGGTKEASRNIETLKDDEDSRDNLSATQVFEYFYSKPVEYILKPFFFASIGFSIPIQKMFNSHIVWRGLVYSVLMLIGKSMTGIWLLGPSISLPFNMASNCTRNLGEGVKKIRYCIGWGRKGTTNELKTSQENITSLDSSNRSAPNPEINTKMSNQLSLPTPPILHSSNEPSLSFSLHPTPQTHSSQKTSHSSNNAPSASRSLYPPAILGSAMVARGEISFLIAAVAHTRGIFSANSDPGSQAMDDIFLIVIWAATICTIVGPLTVGLLIKRLKVLETRRESVGGKDALGAWGVEPDSNKVVGDTSLVKDVRKDHNGK